MSVVIETTLGDLTVDLFLYERPRACLNFLKLCKIKFYNYNLFHTISRGFIAQTGDPTGSRTGGESIFGVLDGSSKRYFEAENEPRIKHTRPGLISFVGAEDNMIGSQFFITLGDDLSYLDEKHCVFGEVVEGLNILEDLNEVICDNDDRPYQDVRITHTVVLDDPYPDPKGLRVPSRSPSPNAERLAGGRIAPDEEIDETSGKSTKEIVEMQAEREAKARATILEMVGDLPDADMAPPENVLFVCKLNPVTTDDDLEIIFSRFGKIKSCEVIRDRKSGDSLQYAFIEFEEQKSCEDAYFKMDNVLIDDRRIHVDFSQSVSKVKWLGKGRGVAHFDDKGGKRKNDARNDIGRGDYKFKQTTNHENKKRSIDRSPKKERKSNSPKRERNKVRSSVDNKFREMKDNKTDSPRKRSLKRRSVSSSTSKSSRGSVSPRRKTKRSRSPKRRGRTPPRMYSRKISRSPRRHSPYRRSFRGRSRSPRRSPYRRNYRNRSISHRRSRREVSKSPKRISRNESRSPRRKYSRSPFRKSFKKSESPKKPLRGRSRSPRIHREKSPRRSYKGKSLSPKEQAKRKSKSPKRPQQNSKSSGKDKFDSPREKSTSPGKIIKRTSSIRDVKSRSITSKMSKTTSPLIQKTQRSVSPKIINDLSIKSSKKSIEKTEKIQRDRPNSGERKKLKRTSSSSKKKISNNKKEEKRLSSSQDSSSEYSSEEESTKPKDKIKKKVKRKRESSTDSSSEDSSSSEEEIVRKKSKNKKIKKTMKVKMSKKNKKKKVSSSSESSSSTSESSSSSSSESSGDNKKTKKLKKKKTKYSSESDSN